jgi:hypothetical protein
LANHTPQESGGQYASTHSKVDSAMQRGMFSRVVHLPVVSFQSTFEECADLLI